MINLILCMGYLIRSGLGCRCHDVVYSMIIIYYLYGFIFVENNAHPCSMKMLNYYAPPAGLRKTM